jgi:hypothetical protein
MATLKIYEGPDAILTFEGDCTINLTPLSTGMNVVVNSRDKLCIATLDLTDIKRLAFDAFGLIKAHGALRDSLTP